MKVQGGGPGSDVRSVVFSGERINGVLAKKPFLGCQFHPEYKSKPLSAHPLFSAFVRAAHENRMHNETAMDKNGEAEPLIAERANAVTAD